MSTPRTYTAPLPGVVAVYRVRRANRKRREAPAITTGTLADGTPCVSVRWHSEHPETGHLVSDGASFTYAEWDEAVRRVASMREAGSRQR